MHLTHILLRVVQCVSVLVSCIQHEVIGGTQTIVLDSETSLLQLSTSKFTAINVTIRPWRVSSLFVFPFLPISHWTDLAEVCSPRVPSGFLSENCPYNSSCDDFNVHQRKSAQFDVPDFWTDRSVIVLSQISVNLTNREPCIQVIACGMPRCEPTKSVDSHCYASFGFVSTHCKARDNGSPPYSSIFSVSQSLKVTVISQPIGLPDYPNSSFSCVASIGYRLMPGVFHCPNGMFLCKPLDKCSGHNYGSCYEQRICLPDSLRCDNHVNCPDSSWDEDNCNGSALHTTPSVSMSWPIAKSADVLQQQADKETSAMHKVLTSLTESDLEFAGYYIAQEVPVVLAGSTVLLMSACVFVLLMVTLFSICCMVRRRHYKRYPPGRRRFGADRFATEVQPVWPGTGRATDFVPSRNCSTAPVEPISTPRPKWLPPAYSDLDADPANTDELHQ